jgi:hypothetical protein
MASCSAGECSCECDRGKGCGCIALSDSPSECECHCYGDGFGGGLKLELDALVDVSISGLPLREAARFLNSVHSEQVLVPADLLNELSKRVHLKVEQKRFADVIESLGLTTNGQRRKKELSRSSPRRGRGTVAARRAGGGPGLGGLETSSRHACGVAPMKAPPPAGYSHVYPHPHVCQFPLGGWH